MNHQRKTLTVVALIVFTITILFAHWDLTGSPDHFNTTKCAPLFAPPDIGPWGKRELANSNFGLWFAIGVIYAGLFAVLGESKPKN